jgi:DNA-damage-inducible protein J
MSKSAMVRARVQPQLERTAEEKFRRLGLSITEAITLFYNQAQLRNGLPFDVVIPSATTRRTFEDTDAGRDLVFCKDAKDMFRRPRI